MGRLSRRADQNSLRLPITVRSGCLAGAVADFGKERGEGPLWGLCRRSSYERSAGQARLRGHAPSLNPFLYMHQSPWPSLAHLFPDEVLSPPLLDRPLEDKNVVVTGAGGSIGGALTDLLLSQRPSRLTLLDSSEHALSTLSTAQSIPVGAASGDDDSVHLMLGDVRMKADRTRALTVGAPDVVIHTAAYKGVPLLERQPIAAVQNNLLATVDWARECREYGVDRFVFLSTDKAVTPVSVMGATKRLAEQALLHDSITAAPGSKDVDMDRRVLRLCNVWGSQGSVVPIFWRRLQNGQLLEVTDPGMKRYFVSPATAALLVSAMADIDVDTDALLCIPDVDVPIKVGTLATRLCRAVGQTSPSDHITVVGPRPGERKEESLLGPREQKDECLRPSLRRVQTAATVAPEAVSATLLRLSDLCAEGDSEAVRNALLRTTWKGDEGETRHQGDSIPGTPFAQFR